MRYIEKECPRCGEKNYGVYSMAVCSRCGKIIDKEKFEEKY